MTPKKVGQEGFIARAPGGFRIGRLELYRIVGSPHFDITRGSCGCILVSLGRYGFTILSKKWDCYPKKTFTDG